MTALITGAPSIGMAFAEAVAAPGRGVGAAT